MKVYKKTPLLDTKDRLSILREISELSGYRTSEKRSDDITDGKTLEELLAIAVQFSEQGKDKDDASGGVEEKVKDGSDFKGGDIEGVVEGVRGAAISNKLH